MPAALAAASPAPQAFDSLSDSLLQLASRLDATSEPEIELMFFKVYFDLLRFARIPPEWMSNHGVSAAPSLSGA